MAHKVQNLVATNITSTSVELSWDDVTSLTGETYDIERDGVIVEMSYAGGMTFTDTGLDPDTEYTYRVRAVGGTTAGEPNPSVTPTTVAARAFMFSPVIAASNPNVSVTLTRIAAQASVFTPAFFESDVDPWGIAAARVLIEQPDEAIVITAGVDDPQDIIDANSAGSTYWFDGVFEMTDSIVPKDGDTLLTNNAVLHGNASWSSGDRDTAGSVAAGALYGFDPRFATSESVTIRGFEIYNYAESGIRVWRGSEVSHCYIHDCFANGLGGPMAHGAGWSPQLLVEDCILFENGSVAKLGNSAGAMKIAGTGDGESWQSGHGIIRVATAGSGAIIRRIWAEGNYGNGIWFDVSPGGDLIEDCVALGNGRSGIFYEIGLGPATIQDCTSQQNRQEVPGGNRAGIWADGSMNLTITHNLLTQNANDYGIHITYGDRQAETGYNVENLVVQNNNLRDSDDLILDGDIPSGEITSSGNTDYGAGVHGATYDGTFDPEVWNATNVVPTTVTAASTVLTIGVDTGTAFSPDDIAGLVAWYDFSDVSTLWQDTARTSAITTDAQVIKGVTDKSGTAHHLSEATNGPAYKTAIRNGLSVSRFDGTNDRLASTVSAAAAQTIFLVLTKNSAPTGAFDGAFSYMDAINAEFTASTALHAANWAYVGDQGGGNPQVGISAAAWHIVTITATTATMSFRSEGGTADATFNPNDVFASGTLFRLGEGPNGFGDIDLAEVVLYDSVLSNANLDLVGNYLAPKWAFTWTGVS